MNRLCASGLLCCLVTLVGLIAPQASGAATCAGVSPQGGGWTTITLPESGNGPGVDFAADPQDPDVMYVAMFGAGTPLSSDVTHLFRSVNGGCDWEVAYETPFIESTSGFRLTIEQVVVTADRDVFLVLHTPLVFSVGGTGRFHSIVVSHDQGRTWETADEGLPGLGSPDPNELNDAGYRESMLVAASGSPDHLYYFGSRPVSDVGSRNAAVYASANGGKSWQLRYRGPNLLEGTATYAQAALLDDEQPYLTDAETHPRDPQQVWTTSAYRVSRSDDGGKTWKQVAMDGRTPLPGFLTLSISDDDPRSTKLTGYPLDPELAEFVYHSNDGGATWTRFPAPFVNVGSLEATGRRGTIMARSWMPPWRIGRFHARSNRWIDLTPSYVFTDSPFGVNTAFLDDDFVASRPPTYFTVSHRGTIERYRGGL